MKFLPPKRDFKILLVDDKPENNTSLQEILEKENRKFITANSGNEALKILLQNKDIGLVMLDVQMPEMDGFEVARLVKSRAVTKDVSIIFVTAINKGEHYVHKGFDAGAVDYLQKPLDINLTKAKVNVFEQLYFVQNDFRLSCNELGKVNKQLENFVNIVSHDLKSPLASIVTILSTISENKTLEEDAGLHDKIDRISMISLELTEMIESILTYSKQSLQEQEIEEVNTTELINQILFLLAPPGGMRIKVSPDMPVLKTRRPKLQQVFLNLISNAIKYNDKSNGLIEIDAQEKDDFYLFSVKDNGQGINGVDKRKLFELFETGGNISGKDSSTGVGLNILKMIVEEQGGKIWMDTKKEEGCCFYFEWKMESSFDSK